MIAVVDYEMGNLRSVQKALESSGGKVTVTSDPKVIAKADAVVLPGVGAFGAAVSNLQERGLMDVLKQTIVKDKPFLGICLGLQLLFEESDEAPGIEGLNVIPGRVAAMKGQVKIPHMGWNQVGYEKKSPLFKGISEDSFFYFVHSFAVVPEQDQDTVGTTEYAGSFVSAVGKGNVFGVQFHPEKSQTKGLRLLKNFIRLI